MIPRNLVEWEDGYGRGTMLVVAPTPVRAFDIAARIEQRRPTTKIISARRLAMRSGRR